MRYTNTFSGQNADFLKYEPGSMYSNHWFWKSYIVILTYIKQVFFFISRSLIIFGLRATTWPKTSRQLIMCVCTQFCAREVTVTLKVSSNLELLWRCVATEVLRRQQYPPETSGDATCSSCERYVKTSLTFRTSGFGTKLGHKSRSSKSKATLKEPAAKGVKRCFVFGMSEVQISDRSPIKKFYGFLSPSM